MTKCRQMAEHIWQVRFDSDEPIHTVSLVTHYTCTCEAYLKNHVCGHIKAVWQKQADGQKRDYRNGGGHDAERLPEACPKAHLSPPSREIPKIENYDPDAWQGWKTPKRIRLGEEKPKDGPYVIANADSHPAKHGLRQHNHVSRQPVDRVSKRCAARVRKTA